MDLTVVVPTLNARDRLATSLDALADHAPDAEIVVVNGPSSDGTSGMVRDHPAPDVLVELSERNLNTARNAGIAAADGDVVAFVSHDSRIEAGWSETVVGAIDGGADVLTGPVHRCVDGGVTTESLETASMGPRSIRYFDGGNVAFTRSTIETLDGFDQHLHTGAARDAAHRLAGMDVTVEWEPGMVVLRQETDDLIHRIGEDELPTMLGLKYHSLGYRLGKNYGLRGRSVTSVVRHLFEEAADEGWNVFRGETRASEWVATGRSVLTNLLKGTQDGLTARMKDRSPTRNPHGVSAGSHPPVATYSL